MGGFTACRAPLPLFRARPALHRSRPCRLPARGILPHATVRSPLLPLAEGADVEIADALKAAGII
jgi:hypothetical protein